MKRGWEMPPLIVECKHGKLPIADGNHRYEALKRKRIKSYWAIIWHDSLRSLLRNNKIKPALFFMTGTSGSGKSTIAKALKKQLPFAEVRDFDEGGVPEGADGKWRRHRTNEWLVKARRCLRNGKLMVVCGVSVPYEIRRSHAYSKSLNVHYGFIHIKEKTIRKRLRARGWSRKLIGDNINWARFLEKAVNAERNHFVVDGQANTPAQAAEKFANWIMREIF